MTSPSNDLIADLVDNLEPVKPFSFARGLSYVLIATAITIAAVAFTMGLRSDLFSGQMVPIVMVASGLFAVLGIAASATVVIMSSPQVGNDHSGWIWAAVMVGLLPLAAMIVSMSGASAPLSQDSLAHALECLTFGGIASLLIFATLVMWLRRGAPTSLERAGLLTGIASGSLGVFAFSLHCPDNDIVHIGLGHSSVVLVAAIIGRVFVPKMVRW